MALGHTSDDLAAAGTEDVPRNMLDRADVKNGAAGARNEMVVHAGGDTDSAEIGIWADHDLIHAGGCLLDEPQNGIWRLPMAPDDGDFRMVVADGFCGLPILDHEQGAGTGGNIEGDWLAGWQPDVVGARLATEIQGAAREMGADRTTKADVRIAAYTQLRQYVGFEACLREQARQVFSCFGVGDVGLHESARTVVAAALSQVFRGPNPSTLVVGRSGCGQRQRDSRPIGRELAAEHGGACGDLALAVASRCLRAGLPVRQ